MLSDNHLFATYTVTIGIGPFFIGGNQPDLAFAVGSQLQQCLMLNHS
ncbi:hypothetical protein MNBD_GAMMA20-1867 [hydrothermal vent metagenome]|uniref:Uncharacterized protein n=1 Tax=hydrothermal vent metagenome TaxID=652676 RepID=A0A3B1ACY7_9ZZZZ